MKLIARSTGLSKLARQRAYFEGFQHFEGDGILAILSDGTGFKPSTQDLRDTPINASLHTIT